ncbi:MAG: acetate kinase [Planctomycetota bacterium]
MKVLVLNCGSSSIKHRLFDMPGDRQLCRGAVERIGEATGGAATIEAVGAEPAKVEASIADHATGVGLLAEQLTATGLLGDAEGAPNTNAGPELVAHRVVHGGERFHAPTPIDDEVLEELDRLTPLAPLHNPANVLGVRLMRERFPEAKHVAVFDTAFHQTMPPRAYRYALPRELTTEHGVRRYGFHGSSHRWAAGRAAEMLHKPIDQLKTIVLHLGAGASACAVDGGRSIDTTMGLTPLEGLVMATRGGDVDPGVLLHLQRQLGYDTDRIDRLLNRESGLVGLCGAGDLRDVLRRGSDGDEDAQLALDVYCYRIAKCVGAYKVALGGADAIVFTAGVGEHSPEVRRRVCEQLAVLGVTLDPSLNTAQSVADRLITDVASSVAVMVIGANEELQLAREASRLIG